MVAQSAEYGRRTRKIVLTIYKYYGPKNGIARERSRRVLSNSADRMVALSLGVYGVSYGDMTCFS